MPIEISETNGLTAADVVHRHASTLAASATVGEVREYFAASASRRLAVLVDDGRYVGAVAVDSLPADADPAGDAAAYAVSEPTIGPDRSAEEARDVALDYPSRRVAVVDDAGALVGVVAIDELLVKFCGT